MQSTYPRLPARRPATRTSALLQPLAPFLALLLAGHASGQDSPTATKPKAQAPVTMTVCESGNRCSDWTFRGKMGSGVGPGGETQVLAIERADDKSMTVHRTDMTGATAGLTADYSGAIVKGRIEGTVVSHWPDHWDAKTDRWTATTGGSAGRLASATTGADGKMVGSWLSPSSPSLPLVVSFDDGKTVRGAANANGYNHLYNGVYVAPDRIDFTVTRIDPKGCKTTAIDHWHLIGDTHMEDQHEGFDGCGVKTGPLRAVADKATAASQVAQQNNSAAGNALLLMLMGIAMGGGGDGPDENCAERTPGTGRCVSQSEAYEKESQRRDSAARAQRSANP